MAWEIERRFLVSVADGLWHALGDGAHYRQGYIRNGEPSVRIRTGEPRGAVLTCKIGSGVRREEVETIVPPEMAVRLLEAAEDRIVEKIRWKLGRWELDRFLGALEGLALMEIELDAESDPLPAPPPRESRCYVKLQMIIALSVGGYPVWIPRSSASL